MAPQMWKFVLEYVANGCNGTKAAIAAGYSERSAHDTACKLLKRPDVKAALERHLEDCRIKSEITVEWILRRWYEIANADVNDLVEMRRECCRFCYGFDHKYQWTAAEYDKALQRAIDAGKPAPSFDGGMDYDPKKPPLATCPECGGLGYERVHVHDSRNLKGASKRLYAGAQRTKDGFKILARDQDAALTNLARYFGMFDEKPKEPTSEVPLAEALKALAERLPV